ncbi:MAG: 4'-phosphopantetheinyl transferase superfamily protein [Oscillospiraceae bacterium]|nr:4'-phosphopantetheinyl transferase superfamily protein [Oscillospiraceae bacterium]
MYRIYALRQPGHEGGRLALQYALAQAGFSPKLEPERLPGGKPVLSGFPFSLSHAGDWAVCAVSDGPVGVDLERERPLRHAVERRLTANEQNELGQLPPEQWASGFFDLWVLKEAALKYTGQGLAGLSQVEVSRQPVRVLLPGVSAALLPFPEAGYHLALCGEARRPERAELVVLN